MFRRNSFAPLLFFLLAVLLLHFSPALSQELESNDKNHAHASILTRDGGHDHHNPHAQPVLELNETEILMHHSPTPPSYYTIDWEDPENAAKRHPGLIVSHALFMGLAFFVALPMGEIPPMISIKVSASHSLD